MSGNSEIIPGLEGIPIAESAISLVEGEIGRLSYQGYSIEDLTYHCSFEEIVALLYDGELPNQSRVDEITDKMHDYRQLTPDQIELARIAGKQSHPMFALQAAVASVGGAKNDFESDLDNVVDRGIALIAKTGHLVGAIAQSADNRDYVGPSDSDSHAAMILKMIVGNDCSQEHIAVMNELLILQADHSAGNASTFTSRVVTSTRSEAEAVASAAIGALSGPAHGGANERAIRLFQEIGSVENAETFLSKMFDAKERIPGFGHRIYHAKDPRSAVIQRIAEEILVEGTESHELYSIALKVEEIATEKLSARGLWPNVDLFSGTVFHGINVPIDFYTPLFAASRMSGWMVHMKEQWDSGNRLFRPRQIYVGNQNKDFLEISKR
jgi:citrate synthase